MLFCETRLYKIPDLQRISCQAMSPEAGNSLTVARNFILLFYLVSLLALIRGSVQVSLFLECCVGLIPCNLCGIMSIEKF